MADREKERVIYTDGGGRSGGTTIAVILGIIALLVVLYLLFGQGLMGGGETTDIKADVDVSGATDGGGS